MFCEKKFKDNRQKNSTTDIDQPPVYKTQIERI